MAPCGGPSGPGAWALRVNYVGTEFPPSKFPKLPTWQSRESPHARCAPASCMLRYSCNVTGGGADTFPPPLQKKGGGDENNRSSFGFDDSSTAAYQWAVLLNAVKPAEATFLGQNSNTMKFMKRGVSEGRCLLSSGYARVSYRPSAFGFFRLSNDERYRQQTRRGRP